MWTTRELRQLARRAARPERFHWGPLPSVPLDRYHDLIRLMNEQIGDVYGRDQYPISDWVSQDEVVLHLLFAAEMVGGKRCGRQMNCAR